MNKDRVYANPLETITAFRFDEAVADVFENMINRSVPGYAQFLDLIGLIANRYAAPGTNCYDLGCSLGASTLMIRRHVPASCHVIGVDNSSAMVERCRANVGRDMSGATIEILEQSIENTLVENASVVALNFTLQFVAPDQRVPVLRRIAQGMNPGGALLLAEKVCFDDDEEQAVMTALHHEFKRYQGYSDLEIAQKRAALENVLVPETGALHLARLRDAGFTSMFLLARSINFSAFIAIR